VLLFTANKDNWPKYNSDRETVKAHNTYNIAPQGISGPCGVQGYFYFASYGKISRKSRKKTHPRINTDMVHTDKEKLFSKTFPGQNYHFLGFKGNISRYV